MCVVVRQNFQFPYLNMWGKSHVNSLYNFFDCNTQIECFSIFTLAYIQSFMLMFLMLIIQQIITVQTIHSQKSLSHIYRKTSSLVYTFSSKWNIVNCVEQTSITKNNLTSNCVLCVYSLLQSSCLSTLSFRNTSGSSLTQTTDEDHFSTIYHLLIKNH